MSHDHDPITLEIIQSSLQATSDEMFAAMRRTAMSAIIYEVLDMGTGITDADGQLASSGAGIPAFVGVLDKAVRRILELNPREQVREGDVYATNDPYHGGVTHLNDVVLAMPVFADGELVAWTANIAHWNDVGGMVPGSISTDAHEIYQEGLRIPAVKLVDAGEPNDAVLRIMEANSRLPDFLRGDMWAGIAAVRIGARRLQELVAKYGHETFVAALAHFMDHGEQVSLKALRELPHGTFALEEEQDSGAVYRVTVEISDDEFVVDLRDNPDQDPGPNNSGRDGATVAAQMLFKALTDPYGAANGGSFRPLTRADPPGVGVRRDRAGRVRRLLRGRDAALRPDLALPRAGARRAAPGRPLREHLRHVHRRPAPGQRPPLHDRRAAGRRLGRLRARRRQQRDLLRVPRRDVQLPRRGGREPLRALRRPDVAQRRGRAGRARSAAGAGSSSSTGSAATAASSPAPTPATGTSRGRSTAGSRARPTSPR